MTEPTAEQVVAITTQDRSLAVEAGAGTGKTWVLVQRFVKMLESHPDWPLDAIVAVTFTERAAREMRDRLRQAIEKRAAEDPDPLWGRHRQALDTLRVSTIHGLCARILRENAIAAAIDPAFDVLDEQSALLLRAEAIRRTFTQLAETDEPALALLADLRIVDVETELGSLLSKRGTVQQLFQQLPEPSQLLERWQSGRMEMGERMWTRQLADEPDIPLALGYLSSVGIIDPTDALTEAVRLAQVGADHIQRGELAQAIPLFAQISRRGGKAANWGGAEGKKELSAMLGIVQSAGKALGDKIGAEIGPLDEAAAAQLQLWRNLWQTLDQIYADLKDEIHALDFDDLELRTLDLLTIRGESDPRLTGFLAGVRHLMVDEFQDTNPIQKQIVYALAPLEGGREEAGRLFVVGDPKQSIYRFRQAQVSIFNRTAQDLRRITGHDPAPLSRSFRTHQELVNALNHLFDHILQPLDGNSPTDFEARPGSLTAVRTLPADHVCPAPVELHLLAAKDDAGESIKVGDARPWEADLLAQRLLDLKASGFPVWDKKAEQYRPFRFGDAAILFRSTTSLPLYEARFKAAGLPYLTVSGRGYYDRPEVQDLLALLAALHNPQDDLSVATILRSPLFSLSDETLYRLRLHNPDGAPSDTPRPLLAALADPPSTDQPERVVHAHRVLTDLTQLAGRVDVWDLLHETMRATGYLAGLGLMDQDGGSGGRRAGNVQKFMALAREQGGASLSDFLRRVQDLQAAEAREGEAQGRTPEEGAVQLMSIHAAKGLEFPVLVVADVGKKPPTGGHPRILHDPAFGLVCQVRDELGDWQKPAGYQWADWLHGEMEEAENKRLLYVACTRAADLLILSGQVGTKSSWLTAIQEVWGIDDSDDTADDASDDITELGEGDATFRVRILRPTFVREERERAEKTQSDGVGLSVLPDLVRPLAEQRRPQQIAVTRLARFLAQEQDDDLPYVRPAVRAPAQAEGAAKSTNRAPGYQVGNLVHRALAEWRFPDLTPADLYDALLGMARQVGIVDAQAQADAVNRARRMVDAVHQSPIFGQIQAAQRVYREISFTLPTPQITLHGTIDLLFQDTDGTWHLVDWKTEWLRPEQREERAQEHLSQLAVYAQAAKQAVGVLPQAQIVFLGGRVRPYLFREEEIVDKWREHEN